ncbi:MAG: isoprenylcysteine carboxylmethyltransferase family protein [Desulfomonile tiedjei]|nr:isoprenylcysteine carboxylmethyltransferase family protein [Desulfomonile tiedjei]
MMDWSQAGRLATTAALWIVWCVVHSLLNSEGPIGKTRVVSHYLGPYYRLIYSVVAVATLALVWWLIPREGETSIWHWHGPFRWAQLSLWVVAAVMFYLSFRWINIWRFLGLSALGIGSRPRASETELVTWGIYGVVRHPQFLAGLILLWSRNLNDTALVTNIALSLYLIIGARIEEKRLLAKLGDEYRKYRSEVPGFIPRLFRPT